LRHLWRCVNVSHRVIPTSTVDDYRGERVVPAMGWAGACARSGLPLVLALVALVAGCSPANERADLAQAVDAAVADAGDGGLVDLGSVLQPDWDTVYGFPGYTSDAEISSAIGTNFGSSDDSRLAEGENLVVLMNEHAISAWFILNRGATQVAVRFDESLYGQPIPRDRATFTAIIREQTVDGRDLFRLTRSP
jgi:hypothetical protein